MSLSAGAKLGPYEILSRIGAGGMGEVYKARDTRLDRWVAIKVLPDHIARREDLRVRFEREARAVASLNHPNICVIHDIGPGYMVMEFIEGETLAARMERGALPLDQAIQFAAQIGSALAAAHRSGIIHRDLKPGNVIVTGEDRVKVLDFGLAKRMESGTPDPTDPDVTLVSPLTLPGVVYGTPAYMSPEQALGEELDPRSDIFSLGAVLYQMVTGKLPFPGPGTVDVLRAVIHKPHRPVVALRPEVPARLAKLIDRCLDKSRHERLASLQEACDTLSGLAFDLAAPKSDVTALALPAAAAPTPGPSGKYKVFAGIAAALVIAFAAAWYSGALRRVTGTAGQTTSVDGASPLALYRSATELLRLHYREGNVDRAIEQLHAALRQKSPYPLAEARLSLALWRKNSVSPDPKLLRQALTYAEQAVNGEPQLAVAHIAHGAALAALNRSAEGTAAYQRALALDPANAELLWRMGDLAAARKDTESAEQLFGRAIAASPKDWEGYGRLGFLVFRQGRYEEALKAYDTMRQLVPDHPRVYSNLAAAYHQLDRTDEAAAALQSSLELSPNAATYSNLGTLHYFQGRYPEAMRAFERAIQLNTNRYLYWGNLADAARLNPGSEQKAKDSYVRAIQMVKDHLANRPDDVDARSSLALYLARSRQTQIALEELAQILAQKNPGVSTLYKSALVAELSGQRAKALDLMGRALDAGYPLREVRREPDFVQLRADAQYLKLAARFEK
ncbi:MAG: protein kinase [Acidobacteria bacterium]|nr:protein kinase [Acidobacteriota bacterium]